MRIIHLVSSAIFIWCLTFFSSCQTPGEPPIITVVDPLQCHVSADGHQIDINLDVSDDDLLAEYSIDLESKSGQIFFSDSREIDGYYHKIEYMIAIQSDEKETYKLTVNVKDIEGNKTKHKYHINVD